MGNSKGLWTPAMEALVCQLFSEALGASSAATQAECRRRLQELGLSEEQIENGFTAGVLEMARLLGRLDVIKAIQLPCPRRSGMNRERS